MQGVRRYATEIFRWRRLTSELITEAMLTGMILAIFLLTLGVFAFTYLKNG